MADWKEKINGYCRCFTGGNNKVGLIPNRDICECNANDLKFTLLSSKHIPKVDMVCAFIKVNIFTGQEIRNAITDLTRTPTSGLIFTQARHKLDKQGYHTFYGKGRIIKAFDKGHI